MPISTVLYSPRTVDEATPPTRRTLSPTSRYPFIFLLLFLSPRAVVYISSHSPPAAPSLGLVTWPPAALSSLVRGHICWLCFSTVANITSYQAARPRAPCPLRHGRHLSLHKLLAVIWDPAIVVEQPVLVSTAFYGSAIA